MVKHWPSLTKGLGSNPTSFSKAQHRSVGVGAGLCWGLQPLPVSSRQYNCPACLKLWFDSSVEEPGVVEGHACNHSS